DSSLKEAYRRHVKGNSLYHNNGDGTFTYTGDSQGIEMGHWSWSCDGCDFDNDGVPEIYIACGMLTNNSTTDLMSYFYRQVVDKSPVKAQAAPAYENGWNAINQLIRQDYSWSGREPRSRWSGQVARRRFRLRFAAHQTDALWLGRSRPRRKDSHRLAVGRRAGIAASRRGLSLRSNRRQRRASVKAA